MRWLWLTLLMVTMPLTGCIGGQGDELEATEGPTADPVFDILELVDGTVHMDVEMPVVFVGFPDATEDALAERLGEETVHHYTGDLNQPIPPEPDEGLEGNAPLAGSNYEMPIVPTAQFQVQPASDDLEASLGAFLGQASIIGDAYSLESFLADALVEDGVDVDPNRPLLVVMNSDAFENPPETWRYQFPNGYLEPVTVFGEREPILVMDTAKMGLDEEGDVQAIEDAVRGAMHYRLLQGSVYPMPTAECHALTLVTAYRPTSLAENHPGFDGIDELFNPDQIEGAFQNLTSDTVHVDVKVLELPMDDPALDALSRGEFSTFEAQRAWISMNWQEYWVEHEGCDAYVSFLIHTDMASAPNAVIGIGTYDEDKGYRIALSWVNDALRLAFDPESPAVDDESLDRFNWVDYLHTHEAGHIFGMRHPHDITTSEGVDSQGTYEDVWSSMSYSTDGRVIDFGAVDRANFERNKAAFLVDAALEAGHGEDPAFEEALEHMAAYEWAQASQALLTLVEGLQSPQEWTPTSGFMATTHDHANHAQ